MITQFIEIAFLSDRDLITLLADVENRVLLVALSDHESSVCDSIIKERVYAQFSYIGWRSFEMDLARMSAPLPDEINECRCEMVVTANRLIRERQFEDYPSSRRT